MFTTKTSPAVFCNTYMGYIGKTLKKCPIIFVCGLKFLFLNIFSKFLHDIVAECQKILPYKVQVCTTKTLLAVVIES